MSVFLSDTVGAATKFLTLCLQFLHKSYIELFRFGRIGTSDPKSIF
jgi:hypothetical protein